MRPEETRALAALRRYFAARDAMPYGWESNAQVSDAWCELVEAARDLRHADQPDQALPQRSQGV